MTGVSTAVAAALAGVTRADVRAAVRDGTLAARRGTPRQWLIDPAAAVIYAAALRGLLPAVPAPAPDAAQDTVPLSPAEVSTALRAVYRAVRAMERGRSQCKDCRRDGGCREHGNRDAELAAYRALQKRLREAGRNTP